MIINGWIKTADGEYYRLDDIEHFTASAYGIKAFQRGESYSIEIWEPDMDDSEDLTDVEIEKMAMDKLEEMLRSC